jgi:hypothetical protein
MLQLLAQHALVTHHLRSRSFLIIIIILILIFSLVYQSSNLGVVATCGSSPLHFSHLPTDLILEIDLLELFRLIYFFEVEYFSRQLDPHVADKVYLVT